MYKFNNEHVVTGYIQQLLHSINLPKCKIFNNIEDAKNYYDNNEAVVLVKKAYNNEDYLIRIKNKNVVSKDLYSYNHQYLNITSNMSLFNGVYDSRTHVYLGNYLRFLRDYKNINLMSMYNCYSDITFTDAKYKYISIPVKYNQKYIVAFTCSNYDYYFGFDNNLKSIQKYFSDNENVNKIVNKKSNFNDPYKIETKILKNKLFFEDNYRLIMRVPLSNEEKIVIIEGDYMLNMYSKIVDIEKNKKQICNIINHDAIKIEANYDNLSDINIDNYLSNIYLLRKKQNNYSEPFSPRLIEYLSGNCITSSEKISKNVIDAKYKLFYRYGTKDQVDKIKQKELKLTDKITEEYRLRFLNAFQKANKKIDDFDLLGYVDKDIEYCLDDETRGKLL